MIFYALEITGKKDKDATCNITRNFWVDRTGSNENCLFLKMVKQCNNLNEVQALTGALPTKQAHGFHGMKVARGRTVSYQYHQIELCGNDTDKSNAVNKLNYLEKKFKEVCEENARLKTIITQAQTQMERL